jgi:hypothetical protein
LGFPFGVAGSPLWKKVRGSGKVAHLARWFDFMAGLPELKEVVAGLDTKKKAIAESVAAGKGGGSKPPHSCCNPPGHVTNPLGMRVNLRTLLSQWV